MTDQLEAARLRYDAAVREVFRHDTEWVEQYPHLMREREANATELAEAWTALIAAARADPEARIEAYGVAVADTLEWLDGHAAPDVTAATIEAKLYAVQGINAVLADSPERCEASASGPRPESETLECAVEKDETAYPLHHWGHHEVEGGEASWTDATTRYPDPPKQEAPRG